jgi:hypothetical protein
MNIVTNNIRQLFVGEPHQVVKITVRYFFGQPQLVLQEPVLRIRIRDP